MLPVQTGARMESHRIRSASPADASAIAGIYAWYVEHSAVTFDEVVPSVEEHAAKISGSSLPFLVAEDSDDVVLGYAYLAPYRPRSAYRFTAELTVYVDPEARGAGIGRALVTQLLAEGAAAGIRQVIAVITATDDGESIEFHRRAGFTEAGRLERVGFKHDRWYDTVFMQRSLAE